MKRDIPRNVGRRKIWPPGEEIKINQPKLNETKGRKIRVRLDGEDK